MAAQRTFPSGESPSDGEGPELERPYGTRPYGTRPDLTSPDGTRPYGTRPYGTRPYGTRPYGTRPYGTRPYGTRPYGTRPDEGDADSLDPQEWRDGVAELFCAGSALLRLGAQLVLGDEEMPVPAAASAGGASTKVRAGALRPMDHELAWEVVVPNPMVRRLVQRPELAEALQGDIARALARRAEEAFLRGNPAAGPRGIRHDPGVLKHVPGGPPHDPVDLLRGMVTKLRRAPRARFHDPGWILSPGALDRLTRHVAAGRSLDDTRLLQHDGQDGGVLLGYPFVATGAAHDDAVAVDTIYFGSDWSEAWIGAGRGVVGIDVSSDAHFARGQTGVRAVVQHDFLLREPACFVVMDLPR